MVIGAAEAHYTFEEITTGISRREKVKEKGKNQKREKDGIVKKKKSRGCGWLEKDVNILGEVVFVCVHHARAD